TTRTETQVSAMADVAYRTDAADFDKPFATSTNVVTADLVAGTYTIADPGAPVNGVLLNIENVQGTNYNDRITGNDAANVLGGWAGNDTLVGGGGNDTLIGGPDADLMTGGAGDDFYYVDNSSDVVVEQQNEGIDT